MPPPMVPAPMMASWFTVRSGVSAGTSGILVVARSATNAWRSALHSGVNISAMKVSRSNAMPASKAIVVDAATASTHFTGAGKFLLRAATVLRANRR